MSAPITRREWLAKSLTGLVLLGFGGLLLNVWSAARRLSSSHWVSFIDLERLPGDGVYAFTAQRVALFVNQDRLAVMSLECTHLGCLVNVQDDGFYCPCHGSNFGPEGQVYSGPAPRNLPWHRLRVKDRRVWFYLGARKTRPHWVSVPAVSPGKVTR